MKAIIFDLDQTLIDSQPIEYLRKMRNWQLVYKSIPSISAYDGIDDIFSLTRMNGIKLAIVSSAPSDYVQKVVQHFEWPFDAIVCYHDTTHHKPHPEPFTKIIEMLKLHASDCWAIGDDSRDIIAAKAADMYAGGALWGSLDKEALLRTIPDQIFTTTASLYDFISNHISGP